MGVPEEKSFLRGGEKRLRTYVPIYLRGNRGKLRRAPKRGGELFGGRQKKTFVCNSADVKEAVKISPKISKPSKNIPKQNELTISEAVKISPKISKPSKNIPKQNELIISLITYETIEEGMVCLGCVADIKDYELKINLPGKLVGFVPITYISETYSSALQDELESGEKEISKLHEIFKVGQFVVTYVVKVESDHVTLSLSPQNVNANMLSYCTDGMVLSSAVKSVQDHGYVMDVGFERVTAFLSFKESMEYETMWNNGKNLGIGQVVRCLIVKRRGSDSDAIMNLSVDPEKVLQAQVTYEPNFCVPGMLLKGTVKKVVESGVVVKIKDAGVGHVHKNHLPELNSITKGKKVLGRILYVKPSNNIVFLTFHKEVGTLKCTSPFKDIELGANIENVTVKGVFDKCIELDVKGHKGLVSHEQTDIMIASDSSDKEITKYLEERYTRGTTYSCRVLDYDYMMQTFVCSLKFSVINECKTGDVVNCCIKSVLQSGIEVSVNSVKGFISSPHIEGDFKEDSVGQEIKARVLFVTSSNVNLTMKSGMVNSKKALLTNSETTSKGSVYVGVVTGTAGKGCQVEFYNQVKGWLPVNLLNGITPRDLYGRVVECRVLNAKLKKPPMILALITVQNEMGDSTLKTNKEDFEVVPIIGRTEIPEKLESLNLGSLYVLTVCKVTQKGLTVRIDSQKRGRIPTPQLSDNIYMSRLLLSLYHVGDQLEARCIREIKQPLFSLSPTILKYFETFQPEQIGPKNRALCLPAYVQDVKKWGLLLKIPDERPLVPVYKENICDGAVYHVQTLGIEKFQTLMTQSVSPTLRTHTTRLSVIWDRDTEYGVNLLREYLTNARRIQREVMMHMKNVYPGQEVEGAVISVTELGAVLQLTNEVSAIVMPYHYQGVELSPGKTLRGRVLFIDLFNNCVEVTLRDDVFFKKDSENMGIKPGITLDGSLLVLKHDVQVVNVEYGDTRHLCYVPTRWHINDLAPTPAFPELGHRCQVCVVRVDDDVIIGVPANLHRASTKILQECKNGKEINSDMPQRYKTNSKLVSCSIRERGVAKKRDTSLEVTTTLNDDQIETNKKQKKRNDSLIVADSDQQNKSNTVVSGGSPDDSNSLNESKKVLLSRKRKVQGKVPVDGKKLKKKKRKSENGDTTAEVELLEESTLEDNQGFCQNVLNDSNEKNNITNEVQGKVLVNGRKKKKKKMQSENGNTTAEVELRGDGNDNSNGRRENSQFVEDKNGKRKSNKVVDNKEVNYLSPNSDDFLCVYEDNQNDFQTNLTGERSDKIQDSMNSGTSEKLNVKASKTKKNKHIGSADDQQSTNASTRSALLSKKLSDTVDSKKEQKKEGDKKRRKSQTVDVFGENLSEGKLKRAKQEADNSSLPCLNVNVGFVWNPTPEQLPAVSMFKTAAEDSSDDEDKILEKANQKKQHRLSVAEKRKQAQEEEERLRKIEVRLMNAENNPMSADDFDRLVLSTPNNSQNWIKYMAFHLQATEIEKARSVGERALQAISFREEQEKFNVWMALLNLENLYGSKESFDKTLKEAVQLNDAFKVYMQVLQMYAESDKFQEMQQLVQIVTKKFKQNKETWIQAGSAYMKSGHFDEARKLMQRALTSLEKKDHVEVITKFARLENEFGEKERCETIMEHTLTSYPKRVDIWCSYVDMLIKSKKLDLARQVLERAVVQKLPVAKMKTMFKKFMQFEQTYGTSEGVEKVRKMATDYVESAVGISGSV